MADNIRSITVLVVDDEEIIRQLLGDTLGALGYTTITAIDYGEAIDSLKNKSIDLAIADIVLPDKSGFELIKYIKNECPGIPVLAISGKQVSKKDVFDAGADGFLTKPFRIGVVEELIQDTLLKYDVYDTVRVPGKKRILVVDDEPDVVSTLVESLQALGYQADGASNGKKGLESLEEKNYDLVITDIRMPEKNGIDFLSDIKRKYPSIKVVIITGYTLAYPPERAKREGADGYIPKPFRINQIDELMAKLLYNFDARHNLSHNK